MMTMSSHQQHHPHPPTSGSFSSAGNNTSSSSSSPQPGQRLRQQVLDRDRVVNATKHPASSTSNHMLQECAISRDYDFYDKVRFSSFIILAMSFLTCLFHVFTRPEQVLGHHHDNDETKQFSTTITTLPQRPTVIRPPPPSKIYWNCTSSKAAMGSASSIFKSASRRVAETVPTVAMFATICAFP
jgi:hypothetical protein